VLIPFDCDSFSRQALYGLLAEIEELKEDHNEGLEVEGIVVNQFQARASLPQQMLDELIAEACRCCRCTWPARCACASRTRPTNRR
jgi:chromosome partitioning protein